MQPFPPPAFAHAPPPPPPSTCDACGACCMQQVYPPFTDDELAFVPDELRVTFELLAAGESNEVRPCVWLDLETRQCRHYDHRPQICRDFERGSASCGLARWRYRVDDRALRLPIIESCDGCGVCCFQQGHPRFTDEERDRVPYELLAPVDEHLAALTEEDFGQTCIWFNMDTRQCRHYEHRPGVCRDFERGSEACVQLRSRYKR
jgi:Fe-S-cluster containining protein